MARVHLLDDELINKIAAGEVVERPASVVKELVENAIDAGATHVKVILKDGGRQLIQVQDDGSGMHPEDAVLAVRRHTTSKLQAADDLFSVKTMGFRGEALASIASVSRFTLQTQSRDFPGHRVHIEDGKQTDSPWQGSPGTCMTVADLFYNVPARRAFLKTAAAEFAACHEYMQALALSLPTVGYTLLHNDREVFAVSPALKTEGHLRGEASMRARAAALIGAEDTGRLIYLQRPDRHAHVEALISPPGLDKGTARHCFTFVNGRWVRDKLLRFALQRGYHSHLMKGKFPIALLYVTIDPALVDVNVHPAKAELRFQYAQEVQNALVQAIREALREGSWASANPPVRTVDSPPVVAPDDFDISLPQETTEEVKRTVMRFDAEPAAPVKTRVQPSLNFDSESAPVRSGATSALSRPAAPMESRSSSPSSAPLSRSPGGASATRSSGLPSASPQPDKKFSAGSTGVSSRPGSAESPAASRLNSVEAPYDAAVSRSGSTETVTGSKSSSSSQATQAQAQAAPAAGSSRSSLPAQADSADALRSPTQVDSSKTEAMSSPTRSADDSGRLLRSVVNDKTISAKPLSAVGALKAASVPSPDGQTTIPWSELQYIGPFARCFLLFEYQQQMLAIDQHAFHERVLYERLVENPDILRRTQPLLMPEVLVFSPTETERLVHMKDALDALGIQIQGVSDTEIEVTAVPSLLVNKDLNSLLAAILGGRDKATELAHDVLATMACHAAVRAGEELPEPELKALLREAESVDFYHNCPHGRRVFRWWKLAQVASWFDR
ncbi:MAG TPA: DNA mismatch repair endonuclease MutL [Oligoflexus sp.]|uniref:DNA mismatch repair endonuclease MutL n=1 Tax=Oligoflexus sp. TaxID=1971216 RepID=UPI002D7E5003|nr:DNA mismatch repair endonuclease MutL [Oligoflexus sp.]HET9237390.1 DNA mismatch repair endonuclease MutL [Oligoflexus sp.]